METRDRRLSIAPGPRSMPVMAAPRALRASTRSRSPVAGGLPRRTDDAQGNGRGQRRRRARPRERAPLGEGAARPQRAPDHQPEDAPERPAVAEPRPRAAAW